MLVCWLLNFLSRHGPRVLRFCRPCGRPSTSHLRPGSRLSRLQARRPKPQKPSIPDSQSWTLNPQAPIPKRQSQAFPKNAAGKIDRAALPDAVKAFEAS